MNCPHGGVFIYDSILTRNEKVKRFEINPLVLWTKRFGEKGAFMMNTEGDFYNIDLASKF